MNRSIAPAVNPLTFFELEQVNTLTLNNGVLMHVLSSGEQEIIRLEIVFNAGSKYDKAAAASFVTSKMLQEGTQRFSASEIQEGIASLGAFIEVNQSVERINLTFYILTKYLSEFLVILEEILLYPSFPKENFDNVISIAKNSLRVNLQKNSVVASQEFKKLLFGENHYYGYSVTEQDLDLLTVDDVKNHYEATIKNKKYEVFVAGFIDKTIQNKLTNFFEKITPTSNVSNSILESKQIQAVKLLIEKPEALQSSIRIGKQIFNRKHPDYFKMLISNELLGGYFGSRLMKNIREDKGLTYGISSQLVSMEETGYFVIGTDVKKENTQLALDEIYKEIEILKTQITDNDELYTVKNYMHGSFLGSINSVFALMDKFKTIHFAHLNYAYYKMYIDALTSITALEIKEIAYKNLNSFTEVVVGNYK